MLPTVFWIHGQEGQFLGGYLTHAIGCGSVNTQKSPLAGLLGLLRFRGVESLLSLLYIFLGYFDQFLHGLIKARHVRGLVRLILIVCAGSGVHLFLYQFAGCVE